MHMTVEQIAKPGTDHGFLLNRESCLRKNRGLSPVFSQLMNNAQLVRQYAMQAQQYVTQLQQMQTMLTNLQQNPLGVQSLDVHRIANNMARLHGMGKDIGSSVARVDENHARMFNNTEAMTYANKFKTWTEGSNDGLKSAMQNAGMQREQFSDDATALQGLTERVSSSQGTLAALQTLGSINAKQVEESMKLRDLIATQQLATNQHLLAQAKAAQEEKKFAKEIMGDPKRPLSPKVLQSVVCNQIKKENPNENLCEHCYGSDV
ncbi:MAG: hypothetical protein Q8L93_02630 [Rhodocyclaceae bacterium]|nr:hypothetical protein [Rhodocyclaceae bacterium]